MTFFWVAAIAVALFVGYYAGAKNEQAVERVRRRLREEQIRNLERAGCTLE